VFFVKTAITDLLGIEYPILQGGMAWVSDGYMAAAVSNAGGAGIIAAADHKPEWLKKEIDRARSLTDKPFGVNIQLMSPYKDEIVELVCREKIGFVTMGAGDPIPYFDRLEKAGIVKIPVVPNLRLAQKVEKAGADAVILEGMEAGGHIGQLTTMALLTQVPPFVRLPVIAAGGIADGRGMAAAIVMGAQGVQIGTRFIASSECPVHPNYKEMLIQAKDTDSIVIGELRGHRVRALKNKFTLEYFQKEREVSNPDLLKGMMKGRVIKATIEGDKNEGLFHAGQSLAVIDRVMTCKEIIEEIIGVCSKILKK
jgi:enoyl-[acyl-carrier protein] reductase II